MEYPNHYQMKQNRLIKLKQASGKCEVCNEPAKAIHHIDLCKDNHNLDNLIVLCTNCHHTLHAEEKRVIKKTTKFIRTYGMTLRQIKEKYGGSQTRYYQMHQKGILAEFLGV